VDGKPYQRQVVVFESALQQAMGGGPATPTLRVAGIEKDPRPFELVYEPGNPDADSHGMVAMPNVNVQEEMADMISASRTFDANLAVIKNARDMALQVLTIGKH
jgi:flagellar basal-body rod protein FlgC